MREHGRTPNPTVCSELRPCGRIDTGFVSEQWISIPTEQGEVLLLRRIELQLDKPTDDGDTVIRVLTNLPKSKFSAEDIASLYRKRWIENMFQRLEGALNSEITALGHPRAALLAFSVAVLAYNVLALIERAIEVRHQLDQTGEIELSAFYLALEIKAAYEGMMIAFPVATGSTMTTSMPASWRPCCCRLRGAPTRAGCANTSSARRCLKSQATRLAPRHADT